MAMTTRTNPAAVFAEFNVETEMTDVELIRVSSDRVLAKGKRYGRTWLLRGLPPEKRNDPDCLNRLREEFDRRFGSVQPGAPLTVGMEEVPGLGPCIVEEWRDDCRDEASLSGTGEDGSRKRRRMVRRGVVIAVAVAALAAICVTGLHIRRLTARAERVKAELENVRKVHAQDQERMLILADSLKKTLEMTIVTEDSAPGVVMAEEDREEKMKAIHRVGLEKFRKELARYDRDVIPQVIDDRPVFFDSIIVLYWRMWDMSRDVYSVERFPQLPEDDRIRLTISLYADCFTSYGFYSTVWMPKALKLHDEKIRKNDSVSNVQ